MAATHLQAVPAPPPPFWGRAKHPQQAQQRGHRETGLDHTLILSLHERHDPTQGRPEWWSSANCLTSRALQQINYGDFSVHKRVHVQAIAVPPSLLAREGSSCSAACTGARTRCLWMTPRCVCERCCTWRASSQVKQVCSKKDRMLYAWCSS